MVNAIEMLTQLLDTVNLRLHHSADDLLPSELTARAVTGVNTIGFIVWHMARSQDWAVNTAIRDLPEIYRDVYILADVEALPNGEIADMLQLSIPAVKSRLHRARLLMRNALAPHFEEAPGS